VNFRTYFRKEAIVFRKTKEEFGGLSNMAAGFPLEVNGLAILTSEALYQACRFPHMPDIQRIIIRQKSPMTAKMEGKPYRRDTRADWQRVKVKIMRWCLQVKLAQNWIKFSQILLDTGDRPIVEESFKDDFWGAKPEGQTLIGTNALGRLLMELRETIKQSDVNSMFVVEPLTIPNFLLDGQAIRAIFVVNKITGTTDAPQVLRNSRMSNETLIAVSQINKMSLFDDQELIEPRKVTQIIVNEHKPYPSYKNSGLSWLGDVPNHWPTLPNRDTFFEIKQRAFPKEEMLSVTINKGVIPQSSLLSQTSKKDSSNEDKSKYKLVFPDDIVYNKMRAWQGAIGVSAYNGIVSPAYIIVRLRKPQNARYFHYLFRTPLFTKEAQRWSYGITSDQWSLRFEEFRQIYCCVPPLFEQNAIVRYLDYMDSRINRYIKAKKKLIELLNEQKQAIIHQAVTRGLDPNVRLKPSGVEWLGEIPEHWEMRRLRNIIKGRLTYGANIAAEYFNTDWPRYLRITDFSKDGVIRTDTFRSLPPDIAKDHLVESGDILFARSGATVGKAFLVTTEAGTACHAGYLIRARPNQSLVIPEFLFAYTQSYAFQAWRDSIFIISTIQNISAEKYATLPIPIPSITEQKRILDLIKLQIQPIDIAISSAKQEIDFLYEYRSRLVADVVTGKLNVRDIAASLPDEIEEDTTDNETELTVDSDLMEDENILSEDSMDA
jgi:type I restriction enzyme, S subunit